MVKYTHRMEARGRSRSIFRQLYTPSFFHNNRWWPQILSCLCVTVVVSTSAAAAAPFRSGKCRFLSIHSFRALPKAACLNRGRRRRKSCQFFPTMREKFRMYNIVFHTPTHITQRVTSAWGRLGLTGPKWCLTWPTRPLEMTSRPARN